jgi:pilus assembly protein TadC
MEIIIRIFFAIVLLVISRTYPYYAKFQFPTSKYPLLRNMTIYFIQIYCKLMALIFLIQAFIIGFSASFYSHYVNDDYQKCILVFVLIASVTFAWIKTKNHTRDHQ